jgi:DNA primase small subunit
LLKQYYERLFPYSKFFKWLSYGKIDTEKSFFENREFSFTLKDDVYIRYRSYANEAEMTADIKKMNPYKIDLGAVFTDKPKDHKKIKASEFKPVERELVFDIDMTDYDEIRTCCQGAAICTKCWFFMNAAVKVVDTALREDFGFSNLLWVYSGRRGVHCWTCDTTARRLTNEGRTAVAEYLNVIAGGDAARKVNIRSPIYPAIERAIRICTGYFEQYVIAAASEGGQDVLAEPESQAKLLSVIGDPKFEEAMLESWAGDGQTSRGRWEELCKELAKESKKMKGKNPFAHRRNEIILQYTYPRLDVAVSTHMNHLLKSPLVVHPKTGRVCVPIDHNDINSFNPFTVPTITDLMRELDEYDSTHPEEPAGGRKVKNYQKTSLVPCLEVFDKFLEGCGAEMRAERDAAKEVEAANAAETGSW